VVQPLARGIPGLGSLPNGASAGPASGLDNTASLNLIRKLGFAQAGHQHDGRSSWGVLTLGELSGMRGGQVAGSPAGIARPGSGGSAAGLSSQMHHDRRRRAAG